MRPPVEVPGDEVEIVGDRLTGHLLEARRERAAVNVPLIPPPSKLRTRNLFIG